MWIIGKEPCVGDIAVGIVRTVFAPEARAAGFKVVDAFQKLGVGVDGF